MTEEHLLPAKEARKRLGQISKMTEARWRRRGYLPEPIRIGPRNFYRESDIARLIEEGANA